MSCLFSIQMGKAFTQIGVVCTYAFSKSVVTELSMRGERDREWVRVRGKTSRLCLLLVHVEEQIGAAAAWHERDVSRSGEGGCNLLGGLDPSNLE